MAHLRLTGRPWGSPDDRAELTEPQRQAALRHLLQRPGPAGSPLLTATRDVDHSQAAVLAEHLRNAG